MAKVFDYKIKLIVAGEPGVGKTSLISKYTNNYSQGIDFKIKIIEHEGKCIKLNIWDIPRGNFPSIYKSYFKGTHGVIIAFDITNANSFKSNRLWIKEFDNNMPYEPCKILVGTKCDLEKERIVIVEEGLKLSDDFNLKYFETSVKTNQNIDEAFLYLVKEVIKAQEEGKFIVKEKPKEETNKNEKKEEKGSGIIF